jgi:CelD/BcsL family acetyltransferase involved in cellulose biosynthesis
VTDQSLEQSLTFRAPPSAKRTAHRALPALDMVDRAAWEMLSARRIEGNGLFDPGFSLPAAALAHGARALVAGDAELTGLLPVGSAWSALKLPLPLLVARQPYGVLGTPLLDATDPEGAAGDLLAAAAASGAQALLIPDLPLDGAAAEALRRAMARRGPAGVVDDIRHRAVLHATGDAEDYLRAGLGAKKLKELRRLANRMGDEGEVRFAEATTPDAIGPAMERFLVLEASGWKGRRGTGLGQNPADAGFARRIAAELGAAGKFRVLELWLGETLIAAGTVIRQGDHALFFKIAFDEVWSRFSPGVQLTVELTRRLIADAEIRVADSSAVEGHPMIDHVWRERMRVGDLYIPLGRLGRPTIAAAIARAHARQAAKSFYLKAKSLGNRK